MDGIADWTTPIISAGIDEALRRCQSDYLDIVHLHSCPLDTLKNSDLLVALQNEVQRGRVRVAAYSGEGDALMYAVNAGVFGGIMCSVNIADQRSMDTVLPTAKVRGLGVIAKRPLANIAWRFNERPVGEYAETYWTRLQAMKLDASPLSWQEMAIRFSSMSHGVSSCIVGTSNLKHLQQNIEMASRGALEARMFKRIRNAFIARDRQWTGEV